jgi:hypothetical protein
VPVQWPRWERPLLRSHRDSGRTRERGRRRTHRGTGGRSRRGRYGGRSGTRTAKDGHGDKARSPVARPATVRVRMRGYDQGREVPPGTRRQDACPAEGRGGSEYRRPAYLTGARPKDQLVARRAGATPPGVSVRDAWEAMWPIDGTKNAGQLADGPHEADPVRSRSEKTPCPCRCACGAFGVNGSPCYLCAQDVHHRCSRACRPYEQVLTVWHGIRALTNYVPARAACGGGKDGSGGTPKGHRRD